MEKSCETLIDEAVAARRFYKYVTSSKIIEFKDYAVIKTRKGDEFKIDLEDVEKCKKFSWCKDSYGYAGTTIFGRRVKLHRFLMFGFEKSKLLIDHVNGDVSDNRRNNLRTCTYAENGRNRIVKKNASKYCAGVRKRDNRYIAEIRYLGRKMHIGSFKTAEEAINARLDAEKTLFGEFAPCVCRR